MLKREKNSALERGSAKRETCIGGLEANSAKQAYKGAYTLRTAGASRYSSCLHPAASLQRPTNARGHCARVPTEYRNSAMQTEWRVQWQFKIALGRTATASPTGAGLTLATTRAAMCWPGQRAAPASRSATKKKMKETRKRGQRLRRKSTSK